MLSYLAAQYITLFCLVKLKSSECVIFLNDGLRFHLCKTVIVNGVPSENERAVIKIQNCLE